MSDDETNAMIIKIVFIFAIWLECFAAGIIPAKSERFRSSPSILGISNSFAGGVFIAIAFMHILPEAVENYNKHIED